MSEGDVMGQDIRLYYTGGYNSELDIELRAMMVRLGYEELGSGYDMKDKRDFHFRLKDTMPAYAVGKI